MVAFFFSSRRQHTSYLRDWSSDVCSSDLVSSQSAELLREAHSKMGAFVTGRRTFDITNGWGGSPPLGVPTFVVTHTVPQEWVYEGSPFTFVKIGRASCRERV